MDNNLTLEKKGVFGDFTSGHFSILAFIWLAYGIYIQSKEFQLQREEFQNQTEQFKEQNKLYEQQMKELEIQSIQNQFDRKIAKLTEIEKDISSSKHGNNDIYSFTNDCRKGSNDFESMKKIYGIYKYLKLYLHIQQFAEEHMNKINLAKELSILKKDTNDSLKISFLLLLFKTQRYANPDQDHKNTFSKLVIYKNLNSHLLLSPQDAINKISNNLQNLDDIDIFEEIVSS